jgi:hypothetical protein
MLFGSQQFEGRGVCKSSGIGIKKNHKQIKYSHRPTQTKQQVGYCIVRTFLVYGQATNKNGFIRLAMTRIWGEVNTFPLIVFCVLGHETSTQMSFCPRIPKLESRNSLNFGNP